MRRPRSSDRWVRGRSRPGRRWLRPRGLGRGRPSGRRSPPGWSDRRCTSPPGRSGSGRDEGSARRWNRFRAARRVARRAPRCGRDRGTAPRCGRLRWSARPSSARRQFARCVERWLRGSPLATSSPVHRRRTDSGGPAQGSRHAAPSDGGQRGSGAVRPARNAGERASPSRPTPVHRKRHPRRRADRARCKAPTRWSHIHPPGTRTLRPISFVVPGWS